MAYSRSVDGSQAEMLLDAIEYLIASGMPVTGITFDKDIDIGDIHLLDIANAKINPATQETVAAILAKIIATPATEASLAKVAAAIGGIDVHLDTQVTGAAAGVWLIHTTDIGIAIPAHAGIDFELNVDAYVVFNTTEANPTAVTNAATEWPRYKPNLNFHKPAVGATWMHIAPVTAAATTMRWSYRAQT